MNNNIAIADELYMEFLSAMLDVCQEMDLGISLNRKNMYRDLNEKFLRFAIAEVREGNSPLSIITSEIVSLIKLGQLKEGTIDFYILEDAPMYKIRN